jgi:hypothetical protein
VADVSTAGRCFAFARTPGTLDLASVPLRIHQLAAPASTWGRPVEIRLLAREATPPDVPSRTPREVVRIRGRLSEADGGFIVERVVEPAVQRVGETLGGPRLGLAPEVRPRNARGSALWLPAHLWVRGRDGRPARGAGTIEFVLPPLPYGDVHELTLRCSVGQVDCGRVRVTWGSFPEMLRPQRLVRRTSGVPTFGRQEGKLETIVLHAMCGIHVVGDRPSRSFDIAPNVRVFRDLDVSAHFLIARDGRIVLTVPIERIAAHAGGQENRHLRGRANRNSIGVELLGFADEFRREVERRYAAHRRHVGERDRARARLARCRAARRSGRRSAVFLGRRLAVDAAVDRAQAALRAAEAEARRDLRWARDYERFTAKNDDRGVPLVFTYTDRQYRSLGTLLEVLGKRYGYIRVCSHRWIRPHRKSDPGRLFDWSRVIPYLLPGRLIGSERGKGGVYMVSGWKPEDRRV